VSEGLLLKTNLDYMPEVKSLMSKGFTYIKIGEILGLNSKRIGRIATAFGLIPNSKIVSVPDSEIVSAFQSGMIYRDMSSTLGIPESTIRKRVRALGLTRAAPRPTKRISRDSVRVIPAIDDSKGHARCEDCGAPTFGNRCVPHAVKFAQSMFPLKGSAYDRQPA